MKKKQSYKGKWKAEGIREFIVRSTTGQLARNYLALGYKIKVPLEAVPIIIQLTSTSDVPNPAEIDKIRLFGYPLEVY
jgi:hypothetical protein